jgi:hypothetical protein
VCLLFSLLICGCTLHENPFIIPKEANISCKKEMCCYPSHNHTMLCIYSDGTSSVMIYFRVVEN